MYSEVRLVQGGSEQSRVEYKAVVTAVTCDLWNTPTMWQGECGRVLCLLAAGLTWTHSILLTPCTVLVRTSTRVQPTVINTFQVYNTYTNQLNLLDVAIA